MIQTERLLLRRFTEEDLDELATIFAKPEVFWFPDKRGLTRAETEQILHNRFITPWDEQGFGPFAVIRLEDNMMLGYTGLAIPSFLPEVLPAVEIGYRFDPAVWGRGYAVEASAAALSFGFDEVGLDRIIAIHHVENVASGRVMDRLGMRLERYTKHPEGGAQLRVCEITREDWRNRAASEPRF